MLLSCRRIEPGTCPGPLRQGGQSGYQTLLIAVPSHTRGPAARVVGCGPQYRFLFYFYFGLAWLGCVPFLIVNGTIVSSNRPGGGVSDRWVCWERDPGRQEAARREAL